MRVKAKYAATLTLGGFTLFHIYSTGKSLAFFKSFSIEEDISW